jgi:two-component system cell cycle sensor histidine kinase/response regulator CckA
LVHEILTENGYRVLDAESAAVALSICENLEPIDLLLTDLVMPKMGGAELSDKVIKMRPDIKVLFMSGYTDDSVTAHGIDEASGAFIEKPFTPDALSRKVREVLSS